MKLIRIWRSRHPRPSREDTPRRDTHVTREQSPLRIGIAPQMPGSMPRAEDDAATREKSPAFHDSPGSGNGTAVRHFYF
ncbi:MAG TPA: hypothetical protein VMO26_26835 [Vicinamibacterales bacterium]|nr:hypothetical protein [Vicinamibacterales bacterium]